MSERKNIDRIFQEKFKDFEAEPSELSWTKIEARLEEKKDRKIIPLWFKLTGVAAVLLIGLMIALTYGNDGSANKQVVVSPERNSGEVDPSADGNPSVNGSDKFADPGSAITSSGEKPNGANDDNANAGGKSNSVTDRDKYPNAGNSSGVNRANETVTSHPTTIPTKRGSSTNKQKSGLTDDSLNPSKTGREQQYASASGRKARSSRNTSTAGNPDVQQNSAIADNGKSVNDKSDKNEKTETIENKNQIAVNENNQSGKADQHNAQKVTENTTTSTQAIAAKTDDTKKDSIALAMANEPNALEELLKNEKENKSVTQNEPKMNRWQVSPRVAPIYLSSSSNGSPIDSRFKSNEKEYKTQLSYGLGVTYAVSKKLAVRAGVNSLAFEYNTNNVVAMQSPVGKQQLEHVNPTVQGAFLRLENKAVDRPIEYTNNGLVVKEFSSSLVQKTGYFEVPVELSYKLLDRRFGIDVIGGFSTLFLNENEVSVLSSDNEMEVGKATNLNGTSFSTNIGIGFRYNLLQALQVNFEPMFKYQLNTYTESGNFKPYFFGLYTGLSYRF